MFTYFRIAWASAGVCLALSVLLLCWPFPIYLLLGMEGGGEVDVLARRAAMLFLGMGVLSWLSRHAPPGEARDAIATGLALSMGALALLGSIEFARDTMGPGIWLAIPVEIFLALGFWQTRSGHTSRPGR